MVDAARPHAGSAYTEPRFATGVSRVITQINLVATLLGALLCLGVGGGSTAWQPIVLTSVIAPGASFCYEPVTSVAALFVVIT